MVQVWWWWRLWRRLRAVTEAGGYALTLTWSILGARWTNGSGVDQSAPRRRRGSKPPPGGVLIQVRIRDRFCCPCIAPPSVLGAVFRLLPPGSASVSPSTWNGRGERAQ